MRKATSICWIPDKTHATVALLLVITAVIAVWSATSRILRIDPMSALRAE